MTKLNSVQFDKDRPKLYDIDCPYIWELVVLFKTNKKSLNVKRPVYLALTL